MFCKANDERRKGEQFAPQKKTGDAADDKKDASRQDCFPNFRHSVNLTFIAIKCSRDKSLYTFDNFFLFLFRNADITIIVIDREMPVTQNPIGKKSK